MTSKDYIEEKLRYLISTFPDIQIKYEHILGTNSHLVEIIPAEFMVANEDYMKEEARIIEEFEQLFPSETIDFISDDSDIRIEHPDLELGVNTNSNY